LAYLDITSLINCGDRIYYAILDTMSGTFQVWLLHCVVLF